VRVTAKISARECKLTLESLVGVAGDVIIYGLVYYPCD
jgi:hypothetical protein